MTVHQATKTGRLRAAWRRAHAPVPGVPRWARITAYAIPFVVLPSGLWRISTVVFDVGGDGAHGTGQIPSWLPGPVYVIFLSVVSELFAFTAVGLVAAWGEVMPRWIPWLGGREVPPFAAILPGALGALSLTVLWTAAFGTSLAGLTLRGDPLPSDSPTVALHGWQRVFFDVTYFPLLLWGPMLAAVCFAYWRRRCPRTTPARAPRTAS